MLITCVYRHSVTHFIRHPKDAFMLKSAIAQHRRNPARTLYLRWARSIRTILGDHERPGLVQCQAEHVLYDHIIDKLDWPCFRP